MPGRPPKEWFYHCVEEVSKNPDIDDPYTLCGWIWHHWMLPSTRRKILRGETMTTYTCRICGKKTRSLQAMLRHYRKEHPEALKRRKTKSKSKGLPERYAKIWEKLEPYVNDLVYEILEDEGLI